MNNPSDLADLLGSGQLRVATGLWLIPISYLGKEEDEARRLSLEPVDLRERLLKTLAPGTKFSQLSADRVIQLIDDVSQEYGDWAGALIYNLDLLLARLPSSDQQLVWHDLFNALPHRRRGIMITMPETAAQLLPFEHSLNMWRLENRLIGTIRNLI